MTDGTAYGRGRPVDQESHELANFSAYSSHNAKEIRRGEDRRRRRRDKKHALSFLWMTGPEYVGNTGFYETNGSYVGCVITRPGSV